MKANLYKLTSLLVLALLVAGCSAAIAKEPTPAATSTPIPDPKESQPTTVPGPDAAEILVGLTREDLQKRLGADTSIAVLEVVPVEFSDTSLGVPEPGQTYAQVLTPGFVIRLAVDDRVFEYHAGNGRAILASVDAVQGEVTIEQVQVSPDAVIVGGRSTFPDGTPIQTELLTGGQGTTWWPESAYATVQEGTWQIAVPLNGEALDPELDYVVYAWAESDESSKVTFPFDLAGPPSDPVPPASGEAEYSRVEIADTGLSIEAPAGWLRLEPEWLWTPAEGSELYLGVQWADLQPPQEAEAALLPTPSQTLYSEQVSLGWGNGRRTLLEVYAPATEGTDQKAPVASVELHVLAVVQQEGLRRAFDLYVRGAKMEDLGTLEPLLQRVLDTSTLAGTSAQTPASGGLTSVEPDQNTGWSALQDETYHYQIAFPTDWAWKELPTQMPGMPDDWPSKRLVFLYPQAWDAQINRSGPPDPTAKPVIAPLQVEVVVGPTDQFRRVFPEPTQSETIDVNGLAVTVEKDVFDGMSLTRYVFARPENPELYVTVTDQMTGFPDRVAGNEAIAEQVPQILQSVLLSDRTQ